MDVGTLRVNFSIDDQQFRVSVGEGTRLLKSLDAQLGQTAKSVKTLETHLRSTSHSFTEIVRTMGLARFALMDIYDIFFRLPAEIIKNTGELERMTQVMYGLSKATNQTARQLEAISGKAFVIDMAKNAPFEIKTIQDAFIKLKSGGIDPTDGSLKALVDSVSKFGGTSEQMHRASIAIQQMAGKGVISMEELRQQLGEAVPDAMRMMSMAVGVSMDELVRRISRGEVTSKEALRRLFIVMKMENDGAAAAMMNTWVGMTSRMKTEWILLQETVGKSGFMDAMKDVGGDLLKFMQSGEAKTMARDLGKALAEVVFALQRIVKFFYEWSDVIKAAGIAYATYFAIAKTQAMFAAIGQGGQNLINTYKSAQAAQIAAAEVSRNIRMASVRDEAQDFARREAMRERELAAIRANLNVQRMAMVQHYSEIAVLQNVYARNAAGRAIDPNTKRFASAAGVELNAAAIASRQREIEVIKQNIAAQEQLQRSHQAIGIVQTAANANSLKYAQSLEKATFAASALTGASRVLGSVVGFLGGPFGALITVATLGALAWDKWGNSAAKAVQKLRDELDRGLVSPAALESQRKVLLGKQQELATLEEKIAAEAGIAKMYPNRDKRILNDLLAQRGAIQSEIASLKLQQDLGREQIGKQDAGAIFDRFKDGLDKEEAARRDALTNKINEIRKATDAELLDAKKSTEEKKKIEIAGNNAVLAENKAFAAKKADILRAQLEDAKKSLAFGAGRDSGAYAAQQDKVRELNSRVLEAERDKVALNSIGPGNPFPFTPGKEVRDPLTDAITRANGDLERAKIRLEDLNDGVINFAQIKKGILAELTQDAKAGAFDKDGEAGKPRVRFDLIAGLPRLEELAQSKAALETMNRARTASSSLLKMEAVANEELQASKDRLANSGDKLDTGYLRMKKSLDQMRKDLVDVNGEFKVAGSSFDDFAKRLLAKAGERGLNDFLSDIAAKTEQLAAQNDDNKLQRMEMEYQRVLNHERRMFEARKANANLTNEELRTATERFSAWEDAYRADHARKMRTPLEQMAIDWKDTTLQMNQSTARWMNDSTEEVLKFTTGAKYDFRALAVSILTDVARIQLRKNIAEPLSNFIGGLGKGLGGIIQGNNAEAGQGFSGMIGSVVKFGKDMFEKISPSAKTVAEGLWAVSDGTEDVVAQTAQEILKGTMKMTVEQQATASLARLTMAANQAASAMASMNTMNTGSFGGMGGLFGGGADPTGAYGSLGVSAVDFALAPFADGGIMTGAGPMSLRKYAAGGIANSPQLAMFGEGSMPEAFVPLPDGRSIPVQMRSSGGSGPGQVQINITVHQSGQVDTKVDKGASQYEGMAQKIKAIVRSEMIDQKRPGGMLAN